MRVCVCVVVSDKRSFFRFSFLVGQVGRSLILCGFLASDIPIRGWTRARKVGPHQPRLTCAALQLPGLTPTFTAPAELYAQAHGPTVLCILPPVCHCSSFAPGTTATSIHVHSRSMELTRKLGSDQNSTPPARRLMSDRGQMRSLLPEAILIMTPAHFDLCRFRMPQRRTLLTST
jgi:hypothetical protein